MAAKRLRDFRASCRGFSTPLTTPPMLGAPPHNPSQMRAVSSEAFMDYIEEQSEKVHSQPSSSSAPPPPVRTTSTTSSSSRRSQNASTRRRKKASPWSSPMSSPRARAAEVGRSFRRHLENTPPSTIGVAAYVVVACFLFIYWLSLTHRLSGLQAELGAGGEKLRAVERYEVAKLLLHRIYEDTTYLLDEAERAVALHNTTLAKETEGLAYGSLLPQLYSCIELAANITSQARVDARHDVLLSISRYDPGSVGSAQWRFKRETLLRSLAGHPLALASTEQSQEWRRQEGGEDRGLSGGEDGGQGGVGAVLRVLLIGVLSIVIVLRSMR